MKAQLKFPKITPKNNVVFFPNCEPKKKMIPLPKSAKHGDRFFEFTADRDFEKYGINLGDLLTCRMTFDLLEITKETVCVIWVKSEDLTITGKAKFDSKRQIVSFACKCEYEAENVEVLGIAVEVRKPLF